MNSSMFSTAEPPPRKWESVDTRNGAISSGHVAATESHHRNCRDGCHGNHRSCSSGSYRDILPNIHDIHSEAGIYGAERVQRTLAYGCTGQQAELFRDHDYHQGMSNNRFYHGISGSFPSNQTGHQHNVCDRSCCRPVDMHREQSSLANCSVDTTRPTSRSSMFVDSLEFHRNAAAVGSMSHCPSTPREVETRSSSLHTGSMANSGFLSQTKGAENQVMLYGWFLMSPHREDDSKDPPPRYSVAIGGYRCPKMQEKDFFASATVVERLERWKLRTSDGREVGLMGIINIEKSVANGFSLSLVQCFMIGFPSVWVYMLLSLQKCGPKGSSPGMPSPSASPTNSAGTTGVIRNNIHDTLGIPMTLLPEANFVQSILQSSLFTAVPDIETRIASFRRCSRDATTPSHDGVSADANAIPQSHLGNEQVHAPKDGDHTCREGGCTSPELAPISDEPSLGRDCSASKTEGVLARDPCEPPETSSQTQMPTKSNGCTSDKVEDERDVFPSPSSSAKENMADEVQAETCNGGAGSRDNENDAVEPASVGPEDPFTPQIRTRRRLRSDTSTSAADGSPVESVMDPKSSPQHVEMSRLRTETPKRAVNTPITLPVSGLVGKVCTGKNKKRLRAESPVDDSPEVEPSTVSAADPVSKVKPMDGSKRQRSEPHSPVADILEVRPNTVSAADFEGTVKARERRKLRSKSHAADMPVVEPVAVSGADDPVGTSKTRDRRKRRKSESQSPVPDSPLVEPVTEPVHNFLSSDSRVGASPDVTEEKAEAELREEFQEHDIVTKREALDVEVNQSCEGKNVVKGRVRKKRYKIPRKYYQRGKKKSSSKSAEAHEKVPPRSDRSTGTQKISIEESKLETDESQVVQEITEPVNETVVKEMKEPFKEKVGRSTMSTKRKTPNLGSPLEVPESSAEESQRKRDGRTRTSIVPPALPSPIVADKSKVTEAFGLKRSLHGRVLVPPLATWRSQSIQYDKDGSIIAISDGFEGSNEENCTGYYNFKPPEDKTSQTMRRRLRKAADKASRKR